MRTREERLGQILLDYGIVDPDELEQAFDYQRTWGVRLGRALIDLEMCDEDMILDTLSLQLGVEWVRLTGIDIPLDILEHVPAKTAIELRAIPVGTRKGKLKVAMSDPANLYQLEVLRSVAHVDIVPVLAGDRDIATAIARQYHKMPPRGERSRSSAVARPFKPAETTEPAHAAERTPVTLETLETRKDRSEEKTRPSDEAEAARDNWLDLSEYSAAHGVDITPHPIRARFLT